MCGISGILGPGAGKPEILSAMIGSLVHRGPDDHGLWSDAQAEIALGHRRLSIVDLSPAGHEPMESASKRLVVTFNGEIYNHRAIRASLEEEGRAPDGGWRGHSDIETLIEAIDHWGLEAALERSVGMFAFAIWDRAERRLRLVRDRFGEKPLYYGWAGRDLLFASELKALRVHPDFDGSIDSAALDAFFRRTYIPAPKSIYRDVYKLQPGTILTFSPGGATPAFRESPAVGDKGRGWSLDAYYDYRSEVIAGLAAPFGDEGEALEALDQALSLAVAGQSVADVPVGAFLSGGIDSSAITALYQRQSTIPIRTFSIGFREQGFDEARYAAGVARHLGTVHHEMYVSDEDAREIIPLLPKFYDEPFADSSQIPTYLVSRFARGEVTVALTGDGGDEMFAGYNRHVLIPRLWDRLRKVPFPLRRALGGFAANAPDFVLAALGRAAGLANAGEGAAKMRKGLALASSARSLEQIYAAFLDEWRGEESPVTGFPGGEVFVDVDLGPDAPAIDRLTYGDATSYLPDDILCKVDRASMAVSLETRVPFLDHRVAAVAARVPARMKVRDGRGKHILRQLLYRHVPSSLIDRPKAGFAVPVGQWLKGPLRDWAEDLLTPYALESSGLIEVAPVRARWKRHVSGREDSSAALWAVLMFQAWLREQNINKA